ncbi:hypothetical protein P4H78_30885 [Bacillus cereus]|nr:hypothetical protein [Bacillus cereus]
MTFEDDRKLGIQQGCIVITDQSQYLVVKKNENYSLLSIASAECINFEVSLEHLEEMVQVDLKEKIQDIMYRPEFTRENRTIKFELKPNK